MLSKKKWCVLRFEVSAHAPLVVYSLLFVKSDAYRCFFSSSVMLTSLLM